MRPLPQVGGATLATARTTVPRTAAALIAAAVVAAASPDGARALQVSLLGEGQGIPRGVVNALLAAKDRLYVGTAGAGVAVVDPARRAGSRYTRENGLPSDDVRSLALFDGKVYAGTAGGIAVQEGERWLPVTKVGTVDLRNVVLAASPDGKELWAGSVHLTGGVVRFDGREWTFLGGEGRGLLNEVGSFAFVPGGVLMGAVSGGVYRKADGNVESLREGFPPANVFAVGERGGTYYAGTNKGLFVWRGARWEAARVPDAFSGGAVFALARADIDLFVGGRNGLLLLDRRGEARLLSGTGGVPAGPVTALAASGETVYAAVEGTVAVIREWQ